MADPFELRSLHDDPNHAGVLAELRAELDRLSDEVGDVAPDADPRARRKGRMTDTNERPRRLGSRIGLRSDAEAGLELPGWPRP